MRNGPKPFTLHDIGIGAGHAIWGFRAAVMNRSDCPTLLKGFENILHTKGRSAIQSLAALARILGVEGRRKLGVACPGCGYVTADELSIVAVLSAMQRQNGPLADAHIAWLMCGRGEAQAKSAADRVALLFEAGNLMIDPPPVEISPPKKPLEDISLHSVGHA